MLQTSVVDGKLQEGSQIQMSCRWRVLCWFVAFTIRFKKPSRRNDEDRLSESSVSEESVTPVEEKSIQFETLYVTAEIVRSVLYSTKDNVLCLHEVFRQVGLVYSNIQLFPKKAACVCWFYSFIRV